MSLTEQYPAELGLKILLLSPDGNFFLTDVADFEQFFRLIQANPFPKAKPFKQWLEKVVYERIEESCTK